MKGINYKVIEANTPIWSASQNISQVSWLLGQALGRDGDYLKIAYMNEALREIQAIEEKLEKSRAIIAEAIASVENEEAA